MVKHVTLVLLFVMEVCTLGCAQSTTLTRAKAKDGEIIAAIKARWTADDNEELVALKNKLQAELAECRGYDTVNRCQFYSTANSGFGSGFSGPGWYLMTYNPVFAFGDRSNTQDDCVQAHCVLEATRSGPYSDAMTRDKERSEIANFKFQANENVVTVEKTNNYEGNIISYVDLRTKGTDDIERCKVTMKLQNNTLGVVSMECPPPRLSGYKSNRLNWLA
jgi:hypothetical protein